MSPLRSILFGAPSVVGRSLALLLAVTAPGRAAAAEEPPRPHPVLQAIEQAQGSFQRGAFADTVHELEDALRRARALAPMEVRQAVVVASPPAGLGIYQPAPQNRLRDRQLRLYVEVAGFHHRALPADASGPRYEVKLRVTGVFFMDGVRLGERSLGTHELVTRAPLDRTSFGVEALLGPKAPAGAYEVLLQVEDANSDKHAAYRTHFWLSRP